MHWKNSSRIFLGVIVDTYVTDEQQAEKVKQWWSDNGRYLIAGVVMGLAILYGWNTWKDYRVNQARNASETFATLEKAVDSKEVKQAEDAEWTLLEKYRSTAYAAMGELEIARLYVAENDLTKAAEKLNWVIDHASLTEVQEIATLRLAQVLVDDGKAEAALSLMEQSLPASYVSLREEVRGDAYRALGKVDAAREAYDRALLTAGGNAEYLQLKRDDLGLVEDPAPQG
ncbi:MAG TPA: tetratricopeptide repeat protein [Gammaproteobacteria bacterium]|nr:tetratricopeptide repeat protein [Gammaproteobacteria bacterium]